MPPQQQGTATVAPPPTDQPTGQPNVDVGDAGDGGQMDHFRSIISRLSGGGTPAIDKALAQHHARTEAEASAYSESAKRYYGMVAKARHTGINPLTGQPATPQEIDQWQQQADAMWGNYTKIAGKSKEAKPIIQQVGGLIRHITGHPGAAGGDKGAGTSGGVGSPQGGPAASPQGPSQQGSPTVPPPPQAGASPQPTVPPPPGGEGSPNPLQSSAEGSTMDALAKEQDELRVAGGKKSAEVAADVAGLRDGLSKAGFTPEQIHEVVRSKFGGAGLRAASKMHPIMVMDPNDPTKKIPGLQATSPDENGAFPVYDAKGEIIANPQQLVPQFLPTEHVGEMPVFNPLTGQVEQQPTYSTTRKLPPSTSDGKGKTSSGGKSSSSGGRQGTSTVAPPPGSGGRHGIPMRQFTPLQKQATAIDEARNALIGDDPAKVGGLAADLDVFKNPESVRKVGEYLELVNTQVANEAKAVTGQGPMAAVEWYAQLPQTVIGLQQEALRDASKGLSPQEQRFVADYYRVMGTIGGLRAATGASSAQWSFNTLKSELPTPGPVTNYDEAKRRVRNYVQETNVVAKRNPLSTKTDPDKVSDADYIYAKDPQGQLHKAKKGTALPKGWTLAPTK